MLCVGFVDVLATVLLCEREKPRCSPDQSESSVTAEVSCGCAFLCSKGTTVTAQFLLFFLQKQRVLRAHVESSERGWAGPRPVGGRADGERAGEVSEATVSESRRRER